MLKEAALAVKAHESAAEPTGSAADDANPAPPPVIGARLPPSPAHEAAVAALNAANRGHILKQGYLSKPAKDWFGGWRRRWVVLAPGTLSYVNPKHVYDAELQRRLKVQTVGSNRGATRT